MKLHSALTTLALISSIAAADSDWPGPRGPHFNGTAAEPQPGLPQTFSPTENVAWKTAMPGPSSATPCVSGNHVFVTAAVEETKKLHAICLDRTTGKILWDKPLADGYSMDNRSNLASPSPTTDGKTVVFFFGTGDLYALDFEGNEKWHFDLLEGGDHYFAFQWTFSSSPTIDDGRVYFQVLQRDVSFSFGDSQRGDPDAEPIPSYFAALDLETGKKLFHVVRPAEAEAESLEAFTTPIPAEDGNGKKQILIAGGDDLTGHDPESGKELWRWGTWNPDRIGHWRLVPSPVAGNGIALACAPKGDPVYAVDMASGKLAWKSQTEEVSSDVCTPLFYNGHFYVLNGEKKSKYLSCIEPKSGNVLWTGEIGTRAKIECSPSACDGKIYFMDHHGTVFVAAASPEKFEILHRAEFGSKKLKDLRAGVVPAYGHLFVRTDDMLYCLGGEE